MTEPESEIKTCFIPPSKKDEKIIPKKEKRKRKITEQPQWKQVSVEKQQEIIRCDLKTDTHLENLFLQQIQKKLSGYKTQDIKKNRYSPEQFIQKSDLLEILKKSDLKCFYCQEKVSLLYEDVREPKQWSLDRIDNTIGHNRENVCVACLACNLRRKTIHHERYVLAKQQQLVFIKVSENGEP